MTIDNMRIIMRDLDRLRAISRSVSRIDTAGCNGPLTRRQEARRERLLKEAKLRAEELGLRLYHQSDPRGCALYLIDETMDQYNYNNGIALL